MVGTQLVDDSFGEKGDAYDLKAKKLDPALDYLFYGKVPKHRFWEYPRGKCIQSSLNFFSVVKNPLRVRQGWAYF